MMMMMMMMKKGSERSAGREGDVNGDEREVLETRLSEERRANRGKGTESEANKGIHHFGRIGNRMRHGEGNGNWDRPKIYDRKSVVKNKIRGGRILVG
jgi:hypothetical protein